MRSPPTWPRTRTSRPARGCWPAGGSWSACWQPMRRPCWARSTAYGRWPAMSCWAGRRWRCARGRRRAGAGFRVPLSSGWLEMFNLIPREVRFFDLFEQQSEYIIRAAALLHELVHTFADARAKAHSIKEVEHQGDQVTHEIVRRLNTTFITPIDREVIHALASALDDVLDYIEAAAERLVVYRMKRPSSAR